MKCLSWKIDQTEWMMERRVWWKSYTRCEAGEKMEITSKPHLSLLDRLRSDCDYYLGYGNRNARVLAKGDEKSRLGPWKSYGLNLTRTKSRSGLHGHRSWNMKSSCVGNYTNLFEVLSRLIIFGYTMDIVRDNGA